MNKFLSQKQRLITATLYVITIFISFLILNGGLHDILGQSEESSIWFFSGILLVIMGKYVTEPYFSSPTDTLTNSISLALVLVSVSNKSALLGYYFLLYFSIFLFILSLIHIIFKDVNEKFKSVSYWILKNIGSSNFMYSIVYLLSAYSYFANINLPMFICAIAIWICLVFFDIYSMLIKKFCELFGLIRAKKFNSAIGHSIKNTNNNIYTISVPKTNENIQKYNDLKDKLFILKTDSNSYSFCVATGKDYLLDEIWLDLLALTHNNSPITITYEQINLLGIHITNNEPIGFAHSVDISLLDDAILNKIQNSYEFKNQQHFIGFILPDSNINIIKFRINNQRENRIKEGSIVNVKIFHQEILYQVINGITRSESNSSSSDSGFMCAIARKIGIYNYDTNELTSAKWVPITNELVYLSNTNSVIDLKNIANTAIGRLPESDMKILIKNINSLITHNTAILGILGVGKSCLTFELIQKAVSQDIKFICIDITNQYQSNTGIKRYLASSDIIVDLGNVNLNVLEQSSHSTGASNKPNEWGNTQKYTELLDLAFNTFLTKKQEHVLILNPDNHVVKKAQSTFNITESVELSVVEKTKLISESLLKCCMQLGQTDFARCCIVFEEAHSLIPEWNSIVNSGDDRHSNGISKVILQGRKYGLGCFLITQRTANVTKSILNQCNTIFAMRVFDDTGKTFLENYIGKDYSDTLPTLEERHAIVTGKGLEIKQPVIIQLNDMKYTKI